MSVSTRGTRGTRVDVRCRNARAPEVSSLSRRPNAAALTKRKMFRMPGHRQTRNYPLIGPVWRVVRWETSFPSIVRGGRTINNVDGRYNMLSYSD